LTQESKIITTRDRLRLLMDTNQIIPKNRFQDTGLSVAPAAELLDLAQSRFTWLRTKVFQHWNSDYSEDPKQVSDEDQSLGMRRQYKTGFVVMDTRWWVWNILFALLPAIIIALYCELRGKHLMHDFHRRQELAQLRQILGEDEFTEERGNAIIDAKNKAMKQNKQYDIDEQVLNYAISVFDNIFSGIYSSLFQIWQEPLPEINQVEQRESTLAVGGKTTVEVEAIKTTPRSVSETHLVKPKLPENSQQSRITTTSEQTSAKEGLKPLTKEDLLFRIQQLEERLSSQEKSMKQTQIQNEGLEDAEAIRLIGQRMKRLDQSNIQNRFEMDYKEKWRKYLHAEVSGEDKAPIANTPELSDSMRADSSDHLKHSCSIEGTTPSSPPPNDIFIDVLSAMSRMVGLRHIEMSKQPESSIAPPVAANAVVAVPPQTSSDRNEDHLGRSNRHHQADVQSLPSSPVPSRSFDSGSEEPPSECSPMQPWWRFWK
jgi:hypothetical protein